MATEEIMTTRSEHPSPAPATLPIPILEKRPSAVEMFVSLRVLNYRRFALGNMVANTAVWMQRIAMDWLVLQLSGSVAAVGVTVFMQFTPMLFLGLWGGVVADRYSKLKILLCTQSATAVLAGGLAALTLTGVVQVWHLYAISFLLGLVTVIDNPARQVFVNELVGPRHLTNAISLNSSIYQLGGLIGPAVGGILITAVGGGWLFLINSLACAGVVLNLLSLKREQLHQSPAVPPRKKQLKEGIHYVRSKPVIFWTIITVAVTAVFAFNMPVFLSAYANNVFRVGARGYGLFNALVAAGALVGALASTRRTSIRLVVVVGCCAALGTIQAIAGLASGELMFGTLLIGVGVCNLLFITAANSLVQMSSNVQIRGRVISLYILVLLGGQAVGGPIMGWIVDQIGPESAMVISGVVPLLTSLGIAIAIAKNRHLRVSWAPRGYLPWWTVAHQIQRHH